MQEKTAPLEIELKLGLEPAHALALRRHPLLAHYQQRAPVERTLENRYFDTASLELQRQGLELRLRRIGARHLQTLKLVQGTHGGLHRKLEWETALVQPQLNIPALASLIPARLARWARLLHAYAERHDLEPRITTRYHRTTWRLRSVQGDVVEAALDIGEILAGAQRLPLCELELELKSGHARVLFELAAALQADVPLRLEPRGKAERGFTLLRGEAPAPRHARPAGIERSMTPPQALRVIAEECLAQVQANEGGVAELTDPQPVHQARVGLRRLRSALVLFKGIASPAAEVLDGLRWAAGELGHARDAEVLVHDTLRRVPVPDASLVDWSALIEAARLSAAQARQRAARAVRDPRHAAWQLALMAWAWEMSEPLSATSSAPSLPAFAAQQLRRLEKRLVARGDRLPGPTAAERHDTRIAAKKLRYATELLGGLRAKPPRPAQHRLRALAALQQQLGLLNDAEVAEALLARLAAKTAALDQAVLYAQGWLAADAQWRVRRLAKLWKRVRAQL